MSSIFSTQNLQTFLRRKNLRPPSRGGPPPGRPPKRGRSPPGRSPRGPSGRCPSRGASPAGRSPTVFSVLVSSAIILLHSLCWNLRQRSFIVPLNSCPSERSEESEFFSPSAKPQISFGFAQDRLSLSSE